MELGNIGANKIAQKTNSPNQDSLIAFLAISYEWTCWRGPVLT
jgi:hypothetical protein